MNDHVGGPWGRRKRAKFTRPSHRIKRSVARRGHPQRRFGMEASESAARFFPAVRFSTGFARAIHIFSTAGVPSSSGDIRGGGCTMRLGPLVTMRLVALCALLVLT